MNYHSIFVYSWDHYLHKEETNWKDTQLAQLWSSIIFFWLFIFVYQIQVLLHSM